MTPDRWHYFFTTGMATVLLILFASQSQGAPRFDRDFRIVAQVPAALAWEYAAYAELHSLIPLPAEEEPLPPQF